VLAIPEATLNSHFGFGDATFNAQELADLGIKWDQPASSLLFSWYLIEKVKGTYDWSKEDQYVQLAQQYGFATVPVIRPFNAWDQAGWGPSTTTHHYGNTAELGTSRRKPYDMNAYMNFVSAIVERYDGDGRNDMPGLKYPIKYWGTFGEPDMSNFDGTVQDYIEIMEATYKAVKRADPGAKVVQGAMGKAWEYDWIRPVLEKGAEYFDIAAVHSLSSSAYLWVPEYKALLSSYGIDKPLWVTEAEYRIGRYVLNPETTDRDISPEEHGQILAKGYVTAFSYEVDKILYDWFRAPLAGDKRYPYFPPEALAQFQRTALIDENGVKRPAYYAMVTMMRKLEYFTSAEKFSEGRFRFTVGGKNVYVMWGSGALPEEVIGELIVTDIYGKETKTNSSAINLTQNLVFVEIATVPGIR
jgi:hypothetical protein